MTGDSKTTVPSDDITAVPVYHQTDRKGKVADEPEYMASFLMLRQQPTRHYENNGKPYDACLYKIMVCELVQLDDAWHEYDRDWQHYYFWDESYDWKGKKNIQKVVMLEGQAREGLGYYQIRVRYVNHPLNVRGEIQEKIES
ncbi:hypothetical protein LCGC14_3050060 [marine sediment metagenome]|uniref:Uncharacterized protein n=1 Tax=marine sediment metagenome TaxID=412755 RepID=A0A0F8XA98_9ZZZZ